MEQKPAFIEGKFIITFVFVTSQFLMWGLLHSMSHVLNKHFQNVLNVSKASSGLIQLSVFDTYFVMSIPAYYLPIICYVVIFLLGYKFYKVKY